MLLCVDAEDAEDDPKEKLLAIDLGLRAGLALFGWDGRLLWARSHNFGARSRVRKGVGGILDQIDGLTWVYVEGDRSLGDLWRREALRRDIGVRSMGAEVWRARLLLPREQRSGGDAKDAAGILARRVFAWSGLSPPTSLRHDAAEATLIGLFGVLEQGWLDALPDLRGPLPPRP